MRRLTDAELLLLGLVAEMPRHGYELDHVIEQRGMREWTQIGFSSIYFVLGKLQMLGLVVARKPKANVSVKARKVYSVTSAGLKTLASQTVAALRAVQPAYSSLLLGMINWSVLGRDEALAALAARAQALDAELARLGAIQIERQPLPDFVEAVFEYSLGQLRAEAAWTTDTLAYMTHKPWLE